MENTELVTYIKNETQKGVTPLTIREALAQAGWQIGDIDAAFASIQGGEIKKSRYNWNKIWKLGIPSIFISISLLGATRFIFNLWDEDILMLWFPTVGLGALVVIGYLLLGIFKQKMSYIKTAILMLLIFAIAAGGTCLVNLGVFDLGAY